MAAREWNHNAAGQIVIPVPFRSVVGANIKRIADGDRPDPGRRAVRHAIFAEVWDSRAVSSPRNDPRANYSIPSVNHAGRTDLSPAKADTKS